MCDKAGDTYPSNIKFVCKWFITQEMCDKEVRCFFVFHSIPNHNKTQEMCDTVVSEDPFLIRYIPDNIRLHV